MNDDDNDDDDQEDGNDDEEQEGQKKRADVVMRAENEDLMGWLLSAVMGSARSPVKIVDPIGVNRRDYMLFTMMMRMMVQRNRLIKYTTRVQR